MFSVAGRNRRIGGFETVHARGLLNRSTVHRVPRDDVLCFEKKTDRPPVWVGLVGYWLFVAYYCYVICSISVVVWDQYHYHSHYQ